MGGVGVATGNPRLEILAPIVLFLAGGALLLRVAVGGQPNARAGSVQAASSARSA
jgi:hypothetical protein